MNAALRTRVNKVAHHLAAAEEIEVKRLLIEAVQAIQAAGHPLAVVDEYLAEAERTTYLPNLDDWLTARAPASAPAANPVGQARAA
jgi:hypothetical protein